MKLSDVKGTQGMLEAAQRVVAFSAANREALLAAWIAEHGCLPSESVLVEDRTNMLVTRWYVEKRDAAKE